MADDPRRPPAADPASRPDVAPAGVIDWPGLESRYARRPAFVDRLAEVAVTSMCGVPALLREHAAAGRTSDIAMLTHSLRTGTDVIMARTARDLTEAVETACHDGHADAAPLARSLADVVEQLLVALQCRLDSRSR